MRRIVEVFSLLLLAFASGTQADENQERRSVTVRYLKQRMLESHELIRSFDITYVSEADEFPTCNLRTVSALYPAYCFYEGSKFNKVGGEDFFDLDLAKLRNEDVFRDRVLVTKSSCISGVTINRSVKKFLLSDTASLPSKLSSEILFTALGWWPFDSRPGPLQFDGSSCVIPGICDDDAYTLGSTMERCAGSLCYVLHRQRLERLYVSPEHGFSIIGRDYFDPDNSMPTQSLRWRSTEEVAPGIWAPRVIENVHYDHHFRSQDLVGEVDMNARLFIVNCKVNTLSVDNFKEAVMETAGMIEVDGNTYSQRRVKGFELFDELIVAAKDLNPVFRENASTRGFSVSGVFVLLLCVAATAIYLSYKYLNETPKA